MDRDIRKTRTESAPSLQASYTANACRYCGEKQCRYAFAGESRRVVRVCGRCNRPWADQAKSVELGEYHVPDPCLVLDYRHPRLFI